MRISIIVSRVRREDALLILETVGFVREGPDDEPPPGEEPFEVAGEFPEKSLGEIQAIDGILDWKILPAKEEDDVRSTRWPWKQNPETD